VDRAQPAALEAGVMALVLVVDRDVAGHLAVALDRHVAALEAFGRAVPPELLELRGVALKLAGQERPGADTGGSARETAPMFREWLSPAEVAGQLGVSERTVRRRIAAGQLRSRTFGRARRVHRDDLRWEAA
jgi:excisionase family DNA binding protein